MATTDTAPNTVTTTGGSTLTADQLKGWTDAANPDAAQFASNAVQYGMTADQIASAAKLAGMNPNLDANAVNQWVTNTSDANGYTWSPEGTLMRRPSQPTGIVGTAQLGTPMPWNVTPEQTVEGRIASIVNPNNPLMVQARTQAAQDSNAHGLINSSMAVTAGQDAMYRAATPIAAADAATFAKAAGYNADEGNQFAVHRFDAQNQFALADKQNAAQLGVAQLGADTQKSIATLNSDTQQKLAVLDANTRTTLQTQQDANQVLLNTSSQAAQAFNQYVVAAANIQNNPNLDAANKTSALQTLWTTTHSQLQVLGNLTGLDLTSLLDMTAINAPAPAPAAAPNTGIINGVASNSGSSGAVAESVGG